MPKRLSLFQSVRILVAADDPILRALMRDVIAEESGYDRVTGLASADEARAHLGAAPRPSVVVLAMGGDEGIDSPAAHLLAAVHLLAGVRTTGVTRPAHRVVGYAWRAPSDPALRELAAAVGVRWVLRPSPVESLLHAVREAAGEIRAA
jgi:DNA-binding NarL/FixJ family response regulator